MRLREALTKFIEAEREENETKKELFKEEYDERVVAGINYVLDNIEYILNKFK